MSGTGTVSPIVSARTGVTASPSRHGRDPLRESVSGRPFLELRVGEAVAHTTAGFGMFHVAKRGARQGRPATGEAMRIKASKTPKFTVGAGLKNAIKGRS